MGSLRIVNVSESASASEGLSESLGVDVGVELILN